MTLSRPQLLCFVLFLSTILTVSYFASDVPLRVQEKSCRLQFDETNPKASLALENTSGRVIPAQFRLELLDPTNHVRARTVSEDSIKAGKSSLSFALAELEQKAAHKDKLWWRLHYVITPQDASVSPLEGFISASEITPDIFDLQVFASRDARAGMRYQARARTAHPITGQNVSGVNISAIAKYERHEKEVTIKANAITNQDGYAVVVH